METEHTASSVSGRDIFLVYVREGGTYCPI